VRAALLLALTILAGCQGLTELTPERVPPPDRRRVGEGTLDDPSDPCGALDVGTARRLSASAGESDGSRMALLTRPGAESWVAVAWVEHGVEGKAPASVAVQVLLEDATPFGDATYIDAESPYLVDVTARTGTDSFLIASGDLDGGSLVRQLELDDGEWQDEATVALPDVERPRLLVAQDKVFVVGVEPPGEPPPVSITELALPLEDDTSPRTTRLDDVRAYDAVPATNGPTIWLAWDDGSWVWGGALVRNQSDGWAIPFESRAGLPTEYFGELRAGHGTRNLVIASSAYGLSIAYRFDVGNWVALARTDPLAPHLQPDEALPIARGESGARWAVARTYEPGDGTPPEIRIERGHPTEYWCATPGECARITTDLRESTSPEIVAVESGYLVSWSDRLEDDQTEVFVAFVACRATTRPD
jgi:hypothetical protein